MVVYVVVGVYTGCVDHVSAWAGLPGAQNEYRKLRRDYGIENGCEAESNHAVVLHELEVR